MTRPGDETPPRGDGGRRFRGTAPILLGLPPMVEPLRRPPRHPLPATFVAAAWLLLAGTAPVRAQAGDARDAYRQVLGLWASGSWSEAVHELARIERAQGTDVAALKRHERRVLSDLVRVERLGAVAVALLHRETLSAHARAGGNDLVTHSMEMGDWAVDLSLRAEGSIPEVRRTAAVLATALAASLREHRFVDAAAARLRRATVLDPSLAVAFEWAACADEQQGRLGSARELLEQLLALEPDNHPGRLRLAMVETKLGDERARGRLEEIVAGDHRSWVWVFAVQELAQDYARSGRGEEAIALLERASREYPDDQGLAVALAFHDRADGRRTRVALESLAGHGALESARVPYGGWQRREPFERSVEELLARHLPHLERALAKTHSRRLP